LNGEKFPIAPLYSGAISTRDTSPRRSRPSTLAPLFNFPLIQSPNPHITILQNQESSESRIFALVICIINTWSNPSTSCRACPTNAENLEMRPIPSKLSRAPPPTACSARLRRGSAKDGPSLSEMQRKVEKTMKYRMGRRFSAREVGRRRRGLRISRPRLPDGKRARIKSRRHLNHILATPTSPLKSGNEGRREHPTGALQRRRCGSLSTA
jgi:hypothetical protein